MVYDFHFFDVLALETSNIIVLLICEIIQLNFIRTLKKRQQAPERRGDGGGGTSIYKELGCLSYLLGLTERGFL